MKKKIAHITFLLLITICLNGQVNLVVNPSFESYVNNKFGFGPGLCDTTSYNADCWLMGSGSPDYMYKYPYNCYYPCCVPFNGWGNKNAVDGNAYYFFCIGNDTSIGHHFNYESIQGDLSSPLISNKIYCLKFFISLADSSRFATNSIGACFSVDNFYASNQEPLQFIPQVINYYPEFYTGAYWYKIQGHFTAQGGEQHITIGAFGAYNKNNYLIIRDSIETQYSDAGYYVDMVTLIECDNLVKPANAGNDKIICTSDSTSLGSFNNQYYEYEWQPTTGLSNPNSGTPNASPTITTTYTLTQKYFDFPISTDEVTVTVKDCKEPEGLIVYPNPVVDNITFKLLHGLFTNGKIEIYDVIGRKILTILPNDINIISAEMSIYAKGTYLYRAYSEDKMLGTGKFVIQ
jgi:hypothetical protein